jgi:hypothetical protein
MYDPSNIFIQNGWLDHTELVPPDKASQAVEIIPNAVETSTSRGQMY